MDLIMEQMQTNGQLLKLYHIIYVTNTCIMSWERSKPLLIKYCLFSNTYDSDFKSLALN